MALLFGIAGILYGFFGYADARAMAKKCTAETTGTVSSVKAYYATKSSNNDYEATVVPSDAALFGGNTLESIRTRHKYKTDDSVKIWYDPSDTANYYIEFANPGSFGNTLMGCGAILMALGGIMMFSYVRRRNV